ncbi:MAG TPA: hypothetical protein VMR21_04225 [Vicinamibacteria bacterium]|nr:hypothetical protein [Vicinamibacteria bacterium]
MARAALALLLAVALRGCVTYEYEHEFWLSADGSGSVYVTGRPELWAAMKGLEGALSPDEDAAQAAVRALFESSGLSVRRVTLTRRGGRPYLFVSADFEDVNRLAGTPAFPDLRLSLRPEGERLRLEGVWRRPPGGPDLALSERDGAMAVRFHLPSKVYSHRNAFAGVERGNIVGWRQTVAEGLAGRALDPGAVMDQRSILLSTVGLFAAAATAALLLLAGSLFWMVRRGRRSLSEEDRELRSGTSRR